MPNARRTENRYGRGVARFFRGDRGKVSSVSRVQRIDVDLRERMEVGQVFRREDSATAGRVGTCPMDCMSASNESWIARLTATGPVQNEALAELRAILLRRLRKAFSGRNGVDEPLLEDVTQEALLKTLDSLPSFQGRSQFTTWATTIAVRGAFTELRRRHWKDVSLEQITREANLRTEEVGAGDAVERDALIRTMYRIIATELTDRQRTALLAELQGMPLAEIGRRMGNNRNAIYKLTHDARRRLKRGLEVAGYNAADLHALRDPR